MTPLLVFNHYDPLFDQLCHTRTLQGVSNELPRTTPLGFQTGHPLEGPGRMAGVYVNIGRPPGPWLGGRVYVRNPMSGSGWGRLQRSACEEVHHTQRSPSNLGEDSEEDHLQGVERFFTAPIATNRPSHTTDQGPNVLVSKKPLVACFMRFQIFDQQGIGSLGLGHPWPLDHKTVPTA